MRRLPPRIHATCSRGSDGGSHIDGLSYCCQATCNGAVDSDSSKVGGSNGSRLFSLVCRSRLGETHTYYCWCGRYQGGGQRWDSLAGASTRQSSAKGDHVKTSGIGTGSSLSCMHYHVLREYCPRSDARRRSPLLQLFPQPIASAFQSVISLQSRHRNGRGCREYDLGGTLNSHRRREYRAGKFSTSLSMVK